MIGFVSLVIIKFVFEFTSSFFNCLSIFLIFKSFNYIHLSELGFIGFTDDRICFFGYYQIRF